MPRIDGFFAAALLGLSLGAAGLSHAQTTPPAQEGAPTQGMPGMMQGMPMQGGMMMGGCPMMQRSAAMEQRLRRLEERLGVPTPPPTQPGSPG
jgi:hypothetical protein